MFLELRYVQIERMTRIIIMSLYIVNTIVVVMLDHALKNHIHTHVYIIYIYNIYI